jgi:hypothetical protein
MKGSLERSRLRFEDNKINDLTEVGYEVVYWIHLPQDRK